ncbi:4-alpha-glucanotransferase [Desulfosediminicola flagellatus]|uniref:4-alpha-glucanotransferase n=1 Tax=Desulfosediminicola flagellatus TaxID=2569541 RepID=UPI0010ACA3AF|nr:4-alpha-glucanotransferase [Desulfosediminicola flagellatus]
MKTILTEKRRSGILAHISSLPSPYGIGDIGTAGIDFLHVLAESGQSCWQFLPLNPTNSLFDNSPYMSTSAFAGSPLLVSPDLLFNDGLIQKSDLENPPDFSPYFTDYSLVVTYKSGLLKKAFATFSANPPHDLAEFKRSHSWLGDYAIFMALKDHHNNDPWFEWPEDIAARTPDAIQRYGELLKVSIEYYTFEQFIFYSQWQRLRQKATELDILLFGDIPIYVGLDSVDVWAHQDIFELDPNTGKPTLVSGVPPDYFSETGQRWGNPLYRWNSKSSEVEKNLEDWWVERFSVVFELVDIARIDHFRAFESFWAIPAENETAIDGEWLKGPGSQFFDKIEKRLGTLEIVAEDLGIITPEVIELRDKLKFPGMKVLQFAFDGDSSNAFLPHNFETTHCIVYTGTHDNDTTVGWFLSDRLDDHQRSLVKQLANKTLHDSFGIHNDLIYLAMSSTSIMAIFPLQDILGFGNDCKMNSPGVPEGNWKWRCAPEFLTHDLKAHLKHRTLLFGRYKEGR